MPAPSALDELRNFERVLTQRLDILNQEMHTAKTAYDEVAANREVVRQRILYIERVQQAEVNREAQAVANANANANRE